MVATILLILRLGMGAALYAFLGWAFWLLWRDLRSQAHLVSNRQVPPLTVSIIGPEGEEIRRFDYTPITLGRDPSCDCWLNDRTVSNRHAQFSYHHSQWWLEDLGSTNGTLLNGQPVTEAVVLIHGDLLQCGQIRLKIALEPEKGEKLTGTSGEDDA